MALNSMGLGFVFTAKDLASGVMNNVNSNLTRLAGTSQASMAMMGKAMAGGALAMGTMAAGLGGIGAAVSSAMAFGKFGTQLEGVRVIMRATTEDVKRLEEGAIAAGMATQFSPDETIEGLKDMATMGLNVNQSLDTLLPTLNLATASMGDLGVAGAAKAIVGSLKSFTKENLTAQKVSDKLARVTQVTNFQMKDFEIGLSKAAAVAGTFGTSIDDTLVALGLLRNRNIDASSAATAFREAQRRLASDRRAQEAVEKAGVALVDQRTGKMRSAVSIILDFAAATSKMETIERQRLVTQAFGARGLLAFSAVADATATKTTELGDVTLKGAEAIEHLRNEIASADGTVKTFADARMATFEGQVVLLEGLLQTLQNRFGKTFKDVLKPVLQIAVKAVEGLINAWEALPAPARTVIASVFLLGSMMISGAGAFGLLVAAGVLLLPVLKIVAIAMLALGAAFAPVIVAGGVLVAAIIGIKVAIDQNLGGIGDRFHSMWKTVRLVWTAITDLLSNGEFSEAVAGEMAKAKNRGILAFALAVYQQAERIKGFFQGIVDGFMKSSYEFRPAFNELLDALEGLGKAFSNLVSGTSLDLFGEKMDGAAESGEGFGNKLAKGVNKAIKLLTWLTKATEEAVKQFGKLDTAIGPIAPKLESMATGFALLGISEGQATGETEKVASKISWIGIVFTIVGAAINHAVNMIVGPIGVVIAIFVSLWEQTKVVVGTIYQMGAMLGLMVSNIGNGARAWLAFKSIIYVGVRGILRYMTALVGGFAAAIDAIGKLVGIDVGASKLVTGFQKAGEKALIRGFGGRVHRYAETGGLLVGETAPGVFAGPPEAPEPKARKMPEIAELEKTFAAMAKAPPPAAQTGTEPPGGKGLADVGQNVERGMAAALAKVDSRPIQTKFTAEIDGEVLFDKMAEVAKGRGIEGFEPGG